MTQEPGYLALRDRAFAFLTERGRVGQDVLLAHVYGGPPPAMLQARLSAPLLGDPRLERRADGTWGLIGSPPRVSREGLGSLAVTVLALAASGPRPGRGRVVRVCALHLAAGKMVERFTATVNPGKRVPAYVAKRLGLEPEHLDDLHGFGDILNDFRRFLDARPVIAQDARLTWSFVVDEARRVGQVLRDPPLVDANDLAIQLIELKGKPTLALVAAELGIGTVSIARPEEEVRVLGLVVTRLLARAAEQGLAELDTLSTDGPTTLRRQATARALPDEPGIYVMRDRDQTAVYVGKARRLRARVTAYVHRPLGATRRLEGLVGTVQAIDTTRCATDLEALVLEDREIRRLQPRFNTVRLQRSPRLYIRLPPTPVRHAGKRPPAARRLELSPGPASAAGKFVGPFRNETLAAAARLLARRVFALDTLRGGDRDEYDRRLNLAWDFLHGDREAAEAFARQHSTHLLRAVLAFDVEADLLPADPREAVYAVIRPSSAGPEGFLIDRGVCRGWAVCDGNASAFASKLVAADAEPRTQLEHIDVVLRWLGAQRPPARLVHLAGDAQAAADAIEDAVSALGDAGDA